MEWRGNRPHLPYFWASENGGLWIETSVIPKEFMQNLG